MEMKNSSVSPSKYGEVPDGQYADDTAASAGAFGVAAGVLSDEELEPESWLAQAAAVAGSISSLVPMFTK